MSTFKSGIYDPEGIYKFPEHLVTVSVGKALQIANAHATGLALQLTYVGMSVGSDVTKFDDKTKREAGALTLPFIASLPETAIFTFHQATKYEDSGNVSDLSKHTPVMSVTQPNMLKTAQALSNVKAIFDTVQAQINEAVKPAIGCSYSELNPAPVYFTGKATGKAKRSGGVKAFAPMTFKSQ